MCRALAAAVLVASTGPAFAQADCAAIADGKTVWSRPVCAWPQRETYDGTGDWREASSFACADAVSRSGAD